MTLNIQEDINGKISQLYADVLEAIRRSPYFTTDAEKACIKGISLNDLFYTLLSSKPYRKMATSL